MCKCFISICNVFNKIVAAPVTIVAYSRDYKVVNAIKGIRNSSIYVE